MRLLLEHQGHRCALTGELLTPDNAEVDHIQPIAGGGTNTMENVQIVVASVNRAKGTMAQEEFVGMCQRVARHTARQGDCHPPQGG